MFLYFSFISSNFSLSKFNISSVETSNKFSSLNEHSCVSPGESKGNEHSCVNPGESKAILSPKREIYKPDSKAPKYRAGF
jgi:hypothetical protein